MILTSLNSSTRILAIDPSSTCVGYCLATAGEKLLDAGIIHPKTKSAPAMDRIGSIVADLYDLLIEAKANVILVEIPGGKVHGRIQGRGQGLSTYGFAVGRVYESVLRIAVGAHVTGIPESDWTQATPKDVRARLVAAKWPKIDLASDKGLDAADAAGLLLWWLQRRRNLVLGVA